MIFTRAGFSALKFAYMVLLAGIGVGIFIVAGSYFYWQAEKKNDQQSQRSSEDLRGRLVVAKRDRDDLLGSENTYKTLAERGTFVSEQRFDLIEALAALKTRHQLVSLDYEVAPQRPLRLGAGGSYSGVNLVASRVKLKIRAFHDADLVAFLDEFPRLQRGFFPLDRCAIKRGPGVQPVLRPATLQLEDNGPEPPLTQTGAPRVSPPTSAPIPSVPLEAECALEWITMQTKNASGAAPSFSSSTPNARPL